MGGWTTVLTAQTFDGTKNLVNSYRVNILTNVLASCL